ncbi:MAG: hypothetical protein ABGX69_01130 [Methylococcales bacterium]|jgi:hypothetical protein|nr:hypothetical protein [Methylococcales bacterium]
MYSQYETTVINRRRLHDLLAWVNQKYYLEYEVVQENRDVFYVIFHDLSIKQTVSIQHQIKGSSQPEHFDLH